MKLAELEKSLNIIFPDGWHRIYDTGAMEWLELSAEEFRADRDKYLSDPHMFMNIECDCEPIFFDDIPYYITELDEMLEWRKDDQGQKLSDKYRLIPFAHTAGGDIFCFAYSKDDPEPMVIMYIHDCYDNPELWGKSFDEFMFAFMLASVSYWEQDITEDNWNAHLDFLSEEYRSQITDKTISELDDMTHDYFHGCMDTDYLWEITE